MTIFVHLPQAIIFDLDGTLLDTEPLYSRAMQRVLDPFGHTYSLALQRKSVGSDSRHTAQSTIDEFGLPHTSDELLTEREVHLNKFFPDAGEIKGAGDFISRAAAKGIRLGLATSSQRHLCELKLHGRRWTHLLDTIVCGDDDDLTAGKPAPDIFLLCAARMGVTPQDGTQQNGTQENILAFEDSRNGIEAAKAAGMTVVAVINPYATAADRRLADYTIKDYVGLLE